MNYWFKIETEKGEYRFVPQEFKNKKNIDLADFDAYTIEHAINLETIIANALKLDEPITKISIDYKRNGKTKNIEPFSLVRGNETLKKLLEKDPDGRFINLTMGRRRHYGKQVETRVIYALNPILRETRHYIIEELDNGFLDNVYKSNSDFHKTLEIYKRVKPENENGIETQEFIDVEHELYETISEYQTFRNVSMAIYRYERGYTAPSNDKKKSIEQPVVHQSFTVDKKDYYNDGVDGFNQDEEEFLDKEEFEEMVNYKKR